MNGGIQFGFVVLRLDLFEFIKYILIIIIGLTPVEGSDIIARINNSPFRNQVLDLDASEPE